MSEAKTGVLIVEDESSLRSSLSQVFTMLGYGVRSAADGIMALLEIRKETPDILLSDLNMPAMSGFALMAIVRAQFPGIQVVAMSGAYVGPEVPRGVAADSYYQKGSGMSMLLNAMKQAANEEHRRVHEAVWSRGETGRDGQRLAMAACPHCSRNFPFVLNRPSHILADAHCLFCNGLISNLVSGLHHAADSERDGPSAMFQVA